MTNNILTTNSTTALGLNAGDTVYVVAGVSLITNSSAIGAFSPTAFGVSITIDGTMAIVGGGGAAIALPSTAAGFDATGFGGQSISIGAAGTLRNFTTGGAISTIGTSNSVINAGLIATGGTGIINNGVGFSLNNSGQILTSGTGLFQTGGFASVTNSGTIATIGGAAISITGDLADVGNTGRLSGITGIGLSGNFANLRNAGVIDARTGVGVNGNDAHITNTATGQIMSSQTAVVLSGAGTQRISNAGDLDGGIGAVRVDSTPNPGAIKTVITNTGHLQGGEYAMSLGGNNASVFNHGTMDGGSVAAVQMAFGSLTLALVNTGTIRAGDGVAILGNASVETITNSGTIIGNLLLAAGADRVTNAGLIRGAVDLGTGADVVNTIEGRITGSITGGLGNDTVLGGAAGEAISGGADNDRLAGNGGDDVLLGGLGLDALSGGAGNDRLTGDLGKDALTGGIGADLFIFANAASIGLGATRDKITDFTHGVDDLTMVFMNSFIGAAAFTAAGQVRYNATTGILSGSTDADVAAEWTMLLVNKPVLTAADFVF
jgi:RTX calcium-binding nonapeptide repeat (4 copies)